MMEKEEVPNYAEENFLPNATEEEKKKLIEQHNKDIAEIVRGRKTIEEVQNRDEENDKSFFDKQLELTRKNLGITKGEK